MRVLVALRKVATHFGYFVLFVVISACSSNSVLVSKDDSTFKYSELRLRRATEFASGINAPADESSLFLQAEGFYRYRFEPPERTSTSYILEAASAITDFPGLQAFAGSISLADIRLRSSDSAVQLWETLLLRYPQSRLKPLTLYRLGWAYRNVGAEGLPRKSPDEPFDELIKEQPNSNLASLATEAKLVPWKSKSTAASRSLLPGLGQIYVGETKSGIWRLSVAAIAAAAIAYPFYVASQRGNDLKWDRDWQLLLTGLGGLIVLSFDYTSSYQDAMRGVVQRNEQAERKFEETHPDAP